MKMPPELFKSGVAQQVIQTARSGQRVIIDGKNQVLSFYGDDGDEGFNFYDNTSGTKIASLLTYNDGANTGFESTAYSSGNNVSGFVALGTTNVGAVSMAVSNGTTAYGVSGAFSGGDVAGTNYFSAATRWVFSQTVLTGIGADFTLDINTQIVRSYNTLAATAARTSSATTAIEDGLQAGHFLVLQGTSDVNTITIQDGANTAMAGNCILGANDTLTLIWNGTDWVEICRSAN